MKKYILVAALFTAFALVYIERDPAVAEEKVAPSRWCGTGSTHKTRCHWDGANTYAAYKWGCRPVCYKHLEPEDIG